MARRKVKTVSRDLVRNVIRLDQMFPCGIKPAAGGSAAGRTKSTARRKIVTAELYGGPADCRAAGFHDNEHPDDLPRND